MKIIFLDIDGVLNSKNFFMREPIMYNTVEEYYTRSIDHIAVHRLANIIKATEAAIVLSSSWRNYPPCVEAIHRVFKMHGIEDRIIGATPEGEALSVRGNEILGWIKDNTDLVGYYYNYTEYVILDDNDDMLYWQKDNFIQTNAIYGLTDKDANRAISILNRKKTNEDNI
jgi:hypothetical protein